ncbi:MAG: hypothetical protein M1519_01055 [Actinobacteria bacterium]|nr:hypothetical protein [Actinomycetota bacterium]
MCAATSVQRPRSGAKKTGARAPRRDAGVARRFDRAMQCGHSRKWRSMLVRCSRERGERGFTASVVVVARSTGQRSGLRATSRVATALAKAVRARWASTAAWVEFTPSTRASSAPASP